MPSGNFGTVSSQPVADPTQTERFATWRFDGTDLTGLQETDRVTSASQIDVEPIGTPADISVNLKGRGAGDVLIDGARIRAAVLLAQFRSGAT